MAETCYYGSEIKSGDHIRYERGALTSWRKPQPPADAVVLLHWHYDGCVYDIEEMRYCFLVRVPSVHPAYDKVEKVGGG